MQKANKDHTGKGNIKGTTVSISDILLDIVVEDSKRRMPIGRPLLTIAIDTDNNYIVGFHLRFDRIHELHLKDLFHNNMPETIVIHDSYTFRSRQFANECSMFGITVLFNALLHHSHRGALERQFNQLNNAFQNLQPRTATPGKSDVIYRRKQMNVDLSTLKKILRKFIMEFNNMHTVERWPNGKG